MLTKVKELRAQHGLTQQQLADLVHVSSRTIISIEKGQYSPSACRKSPAKAGLFRMYKI